MGEAEDIIFAQRKAAEDEAERARAEFCRKLGAQVRELIPQAIASLKRHNYPSGMYWFKILEVDGEERAAWRIFSSAWESSVYLLADGQLAKVNDFTSGSIIQPEDVGRSKMHFDDNDSATVIADLRRIIDGNFD